MQGISRSKHQHLVDALLQMEQLLNKECEGLQQASEYRVELESMRSNYERLLNELDKQVAEYKTLYHHVKVQFLGRKLKALKKEISAEQPGYLSLQENIRNAYGT